MISYKKAPHYAGFFSFSSSEIASVVCATGSVCIGVSDFTSDVSGFTSAFSALRALSKNIAINSDRPFIISSSLLAKDTPYRNPLNDHNSIMKRSAAICVI